jgi:hypothetical protein
MQILTKTIDKKPVAFRLYPDNQVHACVSGVGIERYIASLSANGSFFMREQEWFTFASEVLAPMPVPYDSEEAAELRNQLFGIVCDVATQLRKEAA